MKTLPTILLGLCAMTACTLSLAAQEIYAPTKIARMDAAAYLQPLPQDGVVPLATIAGDFAKNETAATGKYGGQRITVVGRISELSKGSGENKVMVVTLQDPDASLPAVKADFLYGSFPENSELQISQDGSEAFLVRRDRSGNILGQQPYLSVGQKAAILGDFKELKVGNIVLTACKLLPKERRQGE